MARIKVVSLICMSSISSVWAMLKQLRLGLGSRKEKLMTGVMFWNTGYLWPFAVALSRLMPVRRRPRCSGTSNWAAHIHLIFCVTGKTCIV